MATTSHTRLSRVPLITSAYKATEQDHSTEQYRKLRHNQHSHKLRFKYYGSLTSYATERSGYSSAYDTRLRFSGWRNRTLFASDISTIMINLAASTRNSANVSDVGRYTNETYSSVLVVTIAGLFIFITVSTTAFLSAFCSKRNSVFALQKSQQEDTDGGDCELEEFSVEQNQLPEPGSKTNEPERTFSSASSSCSSSSSSTSLSSRASSVSLNSDRSSRELLRSGRSNRYNWTRLMKRSKSQVLQLLYKRDQTGPGLRHSKSEILGSDFSLTIHHTAPQ